jgi:hypothetical protein
MESNEEIFSQMNAQQRLRLTSSLMAACGRWRDVDNLYTIGDGSG